MTLCAITGAMLRQLEPHAPALADEQAVSVRDDEMVLWHTGDGWQRWQGPAGLYERACAVARGSK